MSRITASIRARRAARCAHRQNDIRWAIRHAVNGSDRDELIEIAVRNDVWI